MNSSIVELLNDVLGESEPKNKGNLAFSCPFCKHYKKKLEIHPDRGQWNCWVCGSKGRTIFSLLKQMGANQSYFIRLFNINPSYKKFKTSQPDQKEIIQLPEEYIPLWTDKSKNIYYNHAIKYLAGRKITMNDILKYRLGYCDSGLYKGMIIIPNYNKQGKLTYFTNRSYSASNNKKFVNPPIGKNVIGFEMQLNWDEPLTIVESGLDAIIIKNNATPLYGKIIPESLKLSILENEVKIINICLDSDALQKALEHSEYFISNGITVNLVKLPIGMDPSRLGYTKTWNLIDKAKPLSLEDIFSFKVSRKL